MRRLKMDRCDILHIIAFVITIISVLLIPKKGIVKAIGGIVFCWVAIDLHFSSQNRPPASIIIFALYFGFGVLFANILFWLKYYILSKIQDRNK